MLRITFVQQTTEPRSLRRYPRGTLRGTAQLAGTFGRCSGELTELSLGGAFVANAAALCAGTRLRVHLLLPRGIRPIEARATVLYTRAANPFSAAGVGLAFTALEDRDGDRIQATIERSDLLHVRLLFSLQAIGLQAGASSRAQLDAECLEAGLPSGLELDELHDRISLALRRYRGEF